jgi:acetyl esterase/lipase
MKRILTPLSFFIFSAILIVSCKKNNGEMSDNPGIAKKMLNVAYGTDSLQKMDIYLPAGRSVTSTKVLAIVHGGSWNSGDKKDLQFVVDSLQKYLPDYAIFNINYRLANNAGGNIFPTQENDVKTAIQFIYNNREAYACNTDKTAILGQSAGGQLAMLAAYTNKTPVKFKSVVNISGVANFAELMAYFTAVNPNIALQLAVLLGGTPASNPTSYAAASPVTHITAQSPPTLIFHGTTDVVVPFTQSSSLAAALNIKGVKNTLVTFQGVGHDFLVSPLAVASTLLNTVNFLNSNNQ